MFGRPCGPPPTGPDSGPCFADSIPTMVPSLTAAGCGLSMAIRMSGGRTVAIDSVDVYDDVNTMRGFNTPRAGVEQDRIRGTA